MQKKRKTPQIYIVYCPFPTQKLALTVAKKLLEKRLIACANVSPKISSVYRWKGLINKDSEAILVAKTTSQKLKKTLSEIKHLHSYETPCIIAYPISEGYPPFLAWVAEECS